MGGGGVKKWLQESKLIIALVFLVLTRCIDRVYNTCPQPLHHHVAAIRGNLSNVLGQVSLPFTMILSRWFLQTQYKRAHVVGAIMVLYGAFVCMIPIFRGDVALNSPDPSVLWILLYVVSCIPSAGANGAFLRLMPELRLKGSSVLFVISSAVCLPLTDILYMVPALAGPLAAQKFTIFDGFALFIIILGMVVYHSEKEEQGVGKDRVLKSPLYASPSVRRLKANIQTRRKKAISTRVVSCGYGAVATEDAV
ncbi:hypothetical protein DYB37_009342 [Aphanomyces astaci]|uniref:Uncharacterized protein n=1 Tax=Aphanomyces astaci TaxID=112090 RepID=A0A3R7DUJ4_APHAT|nr:hypothetical protein DYB35_006113 [Aphanomyces astaci]RHZ17266.1 hypothetical protein DYB37_009342 [Aphanomyces astaci]